ncbi:RHS repeat-associated protein [Amycolatopsis arida]|nr:RHS repeat-associated protein [Amycolatopsis arida]
MARSRLRGRALRELSSTALVATLIISSVSTPPANASVSAGELVIPGSAWAPPDAVNRAPVGGPPPQGAPRQEVNPQAQRHDAEVARDWCGNSDYGTKRDYPLERFPISDRSELLVNTANGNVVITARDLTIKGTGQDLSLSHVFNSTESFDRSAAFDEKWRLTTGADVHLDLSFSNGVVLRGPSGYCVMFDKNGDGSFRPAPGLDARLRRLDNGGYEVTWYNTNERWTFNAEGWLLSQADRNGNTNSLRYFGNGDLASITDSQGRVTTFRYDDGGRLTAIVDPTGTVAASYAYQDGRLASYTDRAGDRTTLEWDTGTGNLLALTDPSRGRYEFMSTEYGRITELATPGPNGPARTRFDYDSQDTYDVDKTIRTDANGHQTIYEYDRQGRQMKATDALGHSRSQTWTANSDIAVTTDGLNNSTTYRYDELNNLISTQLPTGATTSVGYTDAAHPHLPTTVTDPQGNRLSREYDDAGNLTKIHSDGLDVDLWVHTYHQPHGTLASRKNGNGHTTRFEYDERGNLTAEIPPAPMGATRYTYDSLSRLTSVTDGRGVRIDYAYDKLDRVVAISHDGRVLQTMDYDGIGNLTERAVPGVTTTFRWTKTAAASQPTRVERRDGTSTEVVTYGYDPVGNLTTLADGGGTTRYTYDKAYRLTALADPFGQTTTFAYDDTDRRTRTTFPGAGTQHNGYDNSGRRTSLRVTNTAGTELFAATYSYTRGDGSDSDQIQSTTIAGVTTNYTYDSLRRVTRAGSVTFGYDNANNMTNRAGTTFTINPANQFTQVGDQVNEFDGAGNLVGSQNPISSFTYSATNQMLEGYLNGTRIFDATYDTVDQTQRRRITETHNGVTTQHVFQQTALGLTQVIDNGYRTSYTRDPDGTLITEKAADGTRYNLITDHQGSVLALLDSGGNLAATYRYDTYGAVHTNGSAAEDNHLRWLGQYQLRGGLHLLGHRYYNPSFGRFTQPDPTKQEPNPYTYANNDPINNSDPTGAAVNSCLQSNLGAISVAGGSMISMVTFVTAVTTVSTLGVGLAIGGFGVAIVGAVANTPPQEACG